MQTDDLYEAIMTEFLALTKDQPRRPSTMLNAALSAVRPLLATKDKEIADRTGASQRHWRSSGRSAFARRVPTRWVPL